jgi:hypothetical protein
MPRPEQYFSPSARKDVIDRFKLGYSRNEISVTTGISPYHVRHLLNEYHLYYANKLREQAKKDKKSQQDASTSAESSVDSTDDESLGDLSELSDSAVSSQSESDSAAETSQKSSS